MKTITIPILETEGAEYMEDETLVRMPDDPIPFASVTVPVIIDMTMTVKIYRAITDAIGNLSNEHDLFADDQYTLQDIKTAIIEESFRLLAERMEETEP